MFDDQFELTYGPQPKRDEPEAWQRYLNEQHPEPVSHES